MRPRVAVTTEQFWHPVPGGTARATAGTLAGLLELDQYDLIGLAARHSTADVGDPVPPIATRHAPVPRPLLYECWHRLGRLKVETFLGPVDLIWASAMVCPPKTAPMVVTVNDLEFLHHPERLSARGRHFFPKAWEVARRRADLLVCPTQMVTDDLVNQGVDRQLVRTVPLGVSTPEITTDQMLAVRKKFGLPSDFALWVGTLEPRKNLARVVEATRAIDDLVVAFVGPDGWVVDTTDILAPLGPRARRLGRVSEADLHALYAASSVFVLPSLAEGFGLPVAEAMAHGTPVVTSRGTATEEVAAGAAVLVDPLDVDSIELGIRSIVDDHRRSAELTEAGRARAAQLTWTATGLGYRDVFEELL